jgi:16S rRNA (guanine(966)-N(2))-methyltransferase RsmD
MRIVAGRFRGRRLESPESRRIRPTSDRVREALFSIIASRVVGASVLDLFAGTGALGLEALSRGAAQAVFVDQGADAVRIIRANIQRLGVEDQVTVFQGAVSRVIRRLADGRALFDLIFMDPPYGKGYIGTALPLLAGLVQPEAMLIAEHSAKEVPPDGSVAWSFLETRVYGDTALSFYSSRTSETPV